MHTCLRRSLLLASALAPFARPASGAVEFPRVVPGPLEFPRDHGVHRDYRVEWWYLTGSLEDTGGAPLGLQVTFFRLRTSATRLTRAASPPHQLLFAHVALADRRVPACWSISASRAPVRVR